MTTQELLDRIGLSPESAAEMADMLTNPARLSLRALEGGDNLTGWEVRSCPGALLFIERLPATGKTVADLQDEMEEAEARLAAAWAARRALPDPLEGEDEDTYTAEQIAALVRWEDEDAALGAACAAALAEVQECAAALRQAKQEEQVGDLVLVVNDADDQRALYETIMQDVPPDWEGQAHLVMVGVPF